MVITLVKKGYDALLGRGWLVVEKTNHNWKQNTLSIESEGRKYTIDLKNQLVSQDLASDFEEEEYERMEPDEEGVLRLGEYLEDDTDSLRSLFHWQMGDYEVLQADCNMLQIQESEDSYPEGYTEYKEGVTPLNTTPAHIFDQKVEYKEASLQALNPIEVGKTKEIFIGDDWDPVLKAVALRNFMEYRDVFAWTYKDLKGVPLEVCPPDSTHTRSKTSAKMAL